MSLSTLQVGRYTAMHQNSEPFLRIQASRGLEGILHKVSVFLSNACRIPRARRLELKVYLTQDLRLYESAEATKSSA